LDRLRRIELRSWDRWRAAAFRTSWYNYNKLLSIYLGHRLRDRLFSIVVLGDAAAYQHRRVRLRIAEAAASERGARRGLARGSTY